MANVPCTLIAAAVKADVPIVVFPKAADPPTAPVNLVVPELADI